MHTAPRTLAALGTLCLLAAAASCGGGKAASGATGGATATTSASGSSSTGAGAGTTSSSGGTGGQTSTTGSSTSSSSTSSGTGGSPACLSSALLAALGTSHVVVGAAMADATAKAAPFDGRYQYISGGIFDGNVPCASCATGCTTTAPGKPPQSCSNAAGGCAWWGCWQYDQVPPGQFLVDFDTTAKTNKEVPMVTYYQVLQASGVAEGAPEVTVMNNAAFLTRYLADFRFLLQKIGTDRALVHIEPDFWGYCEQKNGDPHAEPAAVKTANPTDCASQENSIAGLGRCLIAMTRKYAPNARVGLHASAWGTNIDVLGNTDPAFDVAGEAAKLGNFLLAAGAGDGNFVVADMSDRDAGYYQSQGKNTWLDDTNTKLPTFHQAFAWAKAVAETVGKPIVWWQIPVGNMSLPNTTNKWKDNRVDYLFGHMNEVAAAHGAGVFFGAGDGAQTTPETDGGNLVAKVKAYAAGGGQVGCP